MARTVADQMVETLAAAGVRRIYGIVGDSLNGFTDSLRRHGGIDWLHVRHEEVAAFAAGADAHLTGHLAVCAGSCGPGNLHLINGLFDCHRSRVPVVAIAAHIPVAEIGSGYFQETHPEQLFRECSLYCELVSTRRRCRASSKSPFGERSPSAASPSSSFPAMSRCRTGTRRERCRSACCRAADRHAGGGRHRPAGGAAEQRQPSHAALRQRLRRRA